MARLVKGRGASTGRRDLSRASFVTTTGAVIVNKVFFYCVSHVAGAAAAGAETSHSSASSLMVYKSSGACLGSPWVLLRLCAAFGCGCGRGKDGVAFGCGCGRGKDGVASSPSSCLMVYKSSGACLGSPWVLLRFLPCCPGLRQQLGVHTRQPLFSMSCSHF